MTSPTADRRQGLVGNTAIKAPVVVAATANITLSGEQTIDGVALLAVNAAGVPDRVLVTAQTSSINNGIYDVNTGAWTRSLDCNKTYDLAQGSMVSVTQGALRSGYYKVTTANPITIGTSALTWQRLLNAPDDLTAAAVEAQNWAEHTGGDVPGYAGHRSAKSWAEEDLTGATYGGSSKDWAQSASKPNAVDESAKTYSGRASTSAAAALASQLAAATSATSASTYAATALTAEAAAAAAASASGTVNFYDTYALANAAVGGLANLAVVEVFVDETQNGQRTRYRKEGGVLVFKMAMPAYRVWYVDSVNGLDANNGRSAATPYLTLAKVLTVLQSGDTIMMARGSEWRESFDLGTAQLCTIDAYGGGPVPIINGADVIVGGTWVLQSGNVYRVDVVMPEAGAAQRCYPGIFEDGELLYEYDVVIDGIGSQAAAIAAVQGRVGSFILWSGGSYTAGWLAGATLRYFVQPSDAGNPAANGKTYEVRKRSYTLRVNRTKVANLVLRRQFHHDGVCLSAGASDSTAGGRYYRVAFDQMARHHVIDPTATFDECIALRINPKYPGYGFHAYRAALAGVSPRYRKCIAIGDFATAGFAGFGTHSGVVGVSSHTELVYEDCETIGCGAGWAGYDADTFTVIRGKARDNLSDIGWTPNVAGTLVDCDFMGASYRPVAMPKVGTTLTLKRTRIAANVADGVFFGSAAAGTLDIQEGCEVAWHAPYFAAVAGMIFMNGAFAVTKIKARKSLFAVMDGQTRAFAFSVSAAAVTTWDIDECDFGGFGLNPAATFNRFTPTVSTNFGGAYAALLGVAGVSATTNRLLNPAKMYAGVPVRDGFGKRKFASWPRPAYSFNALVNSGTGQPRNYVAVGLSTFGSFSNTTAQAGRIIETPSAELYGGCCIPTAQGTYILVGAGGLIRRVTVFGTVFTTIASGTASALRAAATTGSAGTTVIVGDGVLLRSTNDGATWAPATTVTSNNYKAVVFASALFMAVGDGGHIAYSADGDTWTETTSGAANFKSVAFGAGLFVAVGDNPSTSVDNQIKTSPTGAVWTARDTGCPNDLVGVAFGNGLFVAASAYTTTSASDVITSADGITWAAANAELPFNPKSVTYQGLNDEKWVIAGDSTVMAFATDPRLAWKYKSVLAPDVTRLRGTRSGVDGYLAALK